MKIDPKSVLGNIQEAAETVASKAQEVVKETASQTTQTVEKTAGSMQGATDAKGNLQLTGDTVRAKLDKAVSEFKKDVSNTALGAGEGFDAGKKSGEQAHSDTDAQGPKFIAGLAGGIAGSISGAVDGFNVGKSGGSAEDIRNKARADAESSGADAALRSQFLDTSDSERNWYLDYKQYQQSGGTKSYDDWSTERSEKGSEADAKFNTEMQEAKRHGEYDEYRAHGGTMSYADWSLDDYEKRSKEPHQPPTTSHS